MRLTDEMHNEWILFFNRAVFAKNQVFLAFSIVFSADCSIPAAVEAKFTSVIHGIWIAPSLSILPFVNHLLNASIKLLKQVILVAYSLL